MSQRDDNDAASQRSGGSGTSGNLSETSSQRSDAKFLKKRTLGGQKGGHGDEADLLEQKRNLQEGVFACMYTLVRQSALAHWKFAILRVVLDFLMNFIVAFNPSFSVWRIDTDSPVWQVIRWTVWRSPIMRLYGYKTYVTIMYVMVATVALAVVSLVWLTLAMRKQEQSKLLRLAATGLHVVYDVIFVFCYVSLFDYFVFMADCNFTGSSKSHMYFKGVMCLEMPHVLHMFVALAMAVIFLCVTALMIVASCDLNPVTHGYLASPAVAAQLRILCAKAVFIIVSDCLDTNPKLQAVGMTISVLLIMYWHFKEVPFYRRDVSVVWTGLWGGVLFTCGMLLYLCFGKESSEAHYKEMTHAVLYGMFPVIAGFTAICWGYVWWSFRPATKFRDVPPGVKLTKVHKFVSAEEVERLARVMRVFDIEGTVDPEAAAHGETIIKAGLLTFPNSAYLLVLYANYKLEVRKDGPAARTQLQLASKQSPSLVQRYQVFCTNEASKRLKDSQEGGMDLQAYIEFKRNFRAVLRVHKEVLLLQAELWQLCQRTSLRVAQFDAALEALDEAAGRAHQVYKRVLERYPSNGKLLRCYGKFLENIRHDQLAAARAYGEANRHGGGSALLALDLSIVHSDKPEFLTSMSMEDDAVVVIDAEGTIMMVNQGVQRMFGYAKTDLEGANVSVLMPQPFSQRHPSYLQRYISTGEAHILDGVREVVALHKDRFVFPVGLCVTKLSGVGNDSIFLGVLRPLPPNLNSLRAWLAPNGVLLCADQQFASAIGINEGELVGHPASALITPPEELERLLERCQSATADELLIGNVQARLTLKHRYQDPVPIHVTVRLAGTDAQRILVLHCSRVDGSDGSLLAVDTHGRVHFASYEVALLLGYPMRKLVGMRLEQLLPAPFNTLHVKWLRDPPHVLSPASCRSGAVVHLLTASGVQVPVRIKITTVDVETTRGSHTSNTLVYAVKVTKLPTEDLAMENRLVLTTDFTGCILNATPPDSDVFGFPAWKLIGSNLADTVDIFDDWRQRSGQAQLQLILLALLYKEQEMPGASWRVRVHKPDVLASDLPALPGQDAVRQPASISACLQVEMAEGKGELGGVEEDNGESRIRITLWRRDRLSSVMELDEDLVIRRASPQTGLITGCSASSMLRKPLSRFLNIPYGSTWKKLVSSASHHHHHTKSALKATSQCGTISPVMAFIGPHPDSGTMRLMIQGVKTIVPGGRAKITITLYPDTTFAGAHANLMRVLRLDTDVAGSSINGEGGLAGFETESVGLGLSRAISTAPSRKPAVGKPPSSSAASAVPTPQAGSHAPDADAAATAAVQQAPGADNDDCPNTPGESVSADDRAGAADSGSGDGEESRSDADPDVSDDQQQEAVRETAALHRQATSRSEFVAQWVRTITRQVSRVGVGEAPGAEQPTGDKDENGNLLPVVAHQNSRRMALQGLKGTTSARKLGIAVKDAESDGEEGGSGVEGTKDAVAGRAPMRLLSGRQKTEHGGALAPGMDSHEPHNLHHLSKIGGDLDGAHDTAEGDKSDRASESGESSADGSQAAGSTMSSATDGTSANDVVVDARRSRLLKALNKLLLGPTLLTSVDRLRFRSYMLVAVMFVAHVIAYSVIAKFIKSEHINVYNVHRQAMAMDRSQLIAVRAMVGAYCERQNATSKVSICANSLNATLTKLNTNILLMEQYHQGVYLGFKHSEVVRPQAAVYDIWTRPALEYHVYMDTEPPQVVIAHAGAWQLGNRFLAAAREALYLLPLIGDEYKLHRTFHFILTNGLGPLFEGYATSLDLLVNTAWISIEELRRDLIIFMIVEAILVQVCCTLYVMYLVQQTEWVRSLGVLVMVGLPGPVLRQLAASEVKIIDDSDSETDDEDSTAGDDDDRRGPTVLSAAFALNGAVGPNSSETAMAGQGSKAGDETAKEESGRMAREDVLNDAVDAKQGSSSSYDASPGVKAADEKPSGAMRTHTTRNKAADPTKSIPKRRSTWLHINGKGLLPSYWNLLKFMVPFFLWNVAVITVYALSLYDLNGMQGPLASLNMASHVTYRYTRVRAIALAFVTQDDQASRENWRPLLTAELDLFESEYNAVMYGGKPTSMSSGTFQHEVPAGTFETSEFSQAFFRNKGCFRYDQSTCFSPGHEYYEVTHNGLDVMVRRMLSEMRMMVLDDDADVMYNSTRYTFMAAVGANDLYEGLQQAAQMFVDYSISRYDEVIDLHTILLIVSVVLVVGFFIFILWPHTRRVMRDAGTLSALLSLVPPELDVRGHVRLVLRRALGSKKSRRASSSEPAAAIA